MAIRRQTYFFMAAVIFLPFVASAQSVIYVNHAAIGADDGTSWIDAYSFLQDALGAAQSGDEIWVAAGTYRPDQGSQVTLGDRESSFYIPGGVSLFGGFEGAEQSRDERDWNTNETILSGDLLGNDDELITYENPLRQDNSYHVVRIEGVTEPVVLDGFTVADGMAFGIPKSHGSSIWIHANNVPDPAFLVRLSNLLIEKNAAYSSTVMADVSPAVKEPSVVFEKSTVRNNLGTFAGIQIKKGTTVIRDVVFEGNTGGSSGAIFVYGDDLYVIGCVFANNSAQRQIEFSADETETGMYTLYMWDTRFVGNTSEWGDVKVRHSNLLSINNVFDGNTAESYSGAIHISFSEGRIVNNTFAYNSIPSEIAGVITVWDSDVTISNSIFWENTVAGGFEIFGADFSTEPHISLNHSIVQNDLHTFVSDEGGLFTGNPLFADADGPDNIPGTLDDDFRLLNSSPAIDAGVNDSLFADFWDLDEDGDFDEPWPTDILNNMRIFDGGSGNSIVDIGAYEYGAPPIVLADDHAINVLPEQVLLLGNYPNPFNPSTTISYTLPRPSDVQLEVFDLLGKRIRLLDSGFKPSGKYEVTIDATGLPSGIYFYTLTAGDFTQTRKMVVVK